MSADESITILLNEAENFLLQENIDACFIQCEKIEKHLKTKNNIDLKNISLYNTKLSAIKRKLNIIMIKKVK